MAGVELASVSGESGNGAPVEEVGAASSAKGDSAVVARKRTVKERLFATKSVEDFQEQAAHSHLKRTLGPLELTLIGIGASGVAQ